MKIQGIAGVTLVHPDGDMKRSIRSLFRHFTLNRRCQSPTSLEFILWGHRPALIMHICRNMELWIMNTWDHGGGVYGINMDCAMCVGMRLLNLIYWVMCLGSERLFMEIGKPWPFWMHLINVDFTLSKVCVCVLHGGSWVRVWLKNFVGLEKKSRTTVTEKTLKWDFCDLKNN